MTRSGRLVRGSLQIPEKYLTGILAAGRQFNELSFTFTGGSKSSAVNSIQLVDTLQPKENRIFLHQQQQQQQQKTRHIHGH